MRLCYLPANIAWVFLFGTDINSASIQEMDGTRLFGTRRDAVQTARRLGLRVSRAGIVSVA